MPPRSAIGDKSKFEAMAAEKTATMDHPIHQQEGAFQVQHLDFVSSSSVSADDDSLESEIEEEGLLRSSDDVAKTIETESRHHGNWRIVVVSILVLIGAGLSVMTFQSLETQERAEIRVQFDILVSSYMNRATDHVEEILRSLRRLSDQFEMEASASSVEKAIYVTLPRFEYAGRETLKYGIDVVSYAPIIELRDKALQWENYTKNEDTWIAESFSLAALELPSDSRITPYLWHGNDIDGTPIPAIIRPPPFVPLWQTSPPPNVRSVINQDMNGFEFFPSLLDELQRTKGPVLSVITNVSGIWGDTIDQSGNHSILLFPIRTQLGDSRAFQSTLIAAISWDSFLESLNDKETMANANVIVRNSCEQSIYYIREQEYGMNENDDLLIMSSSARLRKSFPLFFNSSNELMMGAGCAYEMVIFSSYQDLASGAGPNLTPLIVIAMFIALSFFFVMYDKFLEGRIAKIAEAAARSNAIVSSLFPTQVHDRLFQQDEVSESQSKRSKQSGKRSTKTKTKYEFESANEEIYDDEMFRTQPIADLFPVATLLFADIAGFTAWSSARQPTEVFTLLETLYRNFDLIAKKRGIFKVETVGDCYVAASGLPEPRKDHAVVMCRFARDCLRKTKELVRKLETILGPDTATLNMRIGIHSGPVTGGVLRGEKSRFQLFGDTMNTASRIETTGTKGRIQISQETADLLIAAGKINWFYPREDKVFAKGKGEMNTFWLKTGGLRRQSVKKDSFMLEESLSHDISSCDVTENEVDMNSESDSDESVSDFDTEKLLNDLVSPKVARLIEFNTEVLIRYLKQIMRKRNATGKSPQHASRQAAVYPLPLCAQETPLPLKLQEVIPMAGFDPSTAAILLERTAGDVVLGEAVVQELHDFVTNVALMHKPANCFHNFDHASHVMLSVTKFLSRMTINASNALRRNDNLVDSAHDLHARSYGISSDPLAQFACVFSALIHDIDHPGVPNDQFVQESPELAEAYQGLSVEEQNSFDLAWGLLMDEQYPSLRSAIFETTEEMERFRSLVVNCVLATDVADDTLRNARNKRWANVFIAEDADTPGMDDFKATLILEYVVRASDVIHAMQHWHIYRQWSGRQFTELYRAFQQGRISEDPSKTWYLQEIEFFDKCIIPTAEKLEQCGVFGVASREAFDYAKQNRKEWIVRGRDVVEEMVASCNKRRSTVRVPLSAPSPTPTRASRNDMAPSQEAQVAALMQQVHMLELEEERLRKECDDV